MTWGSEPPPELATDRLMVAFYAAITAVEDGRIAEADMEHRVIADSGGEEILHITVRREVLSLGAPPADRDEE